MRKTHHLAISLVRIEDAGSDPAYVLREAHHEILTDGVYGRVRNLGELLAEIVEEGLRPCAQHGQRSVVAH